MPQLTVIVRRRLRERDASKRITRG